MYADKTDRTIETGGKPTSQYVQILGKSQQGVDITGDGAKAIDRAKSGYKAQTFLGRRPNIDKKSESQFSWR
jgi:hypothetical protein